MAEAIISDWISDYSSLQESELRTFAAQHENDFEISKALYTVLNERAKYKDVSYESASPENLIATNPRISRLLAHLPGLQSAV